MNPVSMGAPTPPEPTTSWDWAPGEKEELEALARLASGDSLEALISATEGAVIREQKAVDAAKARLGVYLYERWKRADAEVGR